MAVPHAALDAFLRAVLVQAGSSPAEAAIVARHLVDANLAGHDSHGAIRIPIYLDWTARGMVVPNQAMRILRDTGPLLVADGQFGYGQAVAHAATLLAGERARQFGLCALALRNCGHLGRIGTYAELLAERGLVSVHWVNTSGMGILVAPYGGTERRLSTNPIAFGAPAPEGNLVLDMATSASAEGKVSVARNKGTALPAGQLLSRTGKPSTDPNDLYGDPPGALLPLGGYKGSGLAVMCEVLAGSLTGGGSSHPDSPTADRLANNMFSIVLDPAAFGQGDALGADIARMVAWVRSSRRADPDVPVLLPGEPERISRAARLRDGIPLDPATLRQLVDAGAKLGVQLPSPLREMVDA